MDIRTKLVFVLVAVALGSMLALGAFTYGVARDLLRQMALRQLEAVAETKKRKLEQVVEAWEDRIRLIASRTQLRLSLAKLSRGDDTAEQARIDRILNDALSSVRAVRAIVLFDARGQPVGRAPAPAPVEPLPDGMLSATSGAVWHEGLTLDGRGRLEARLVAPLHLEDRRIGAVRVRLAAGELLDATRDYTGLGKTGETLVATRTAEGGALVLVPLRFDPAAALARRIAPDANDPAVRAVRGEEDIFTEGVVDYRGEPVWAATRHLASQDWGIVVKVDAAEELRVVRDLRDTMITLALALSAFAIVLGTLLGLWFARPIRELADVAARIRRGALDVRAHVHSEDEIGLLALTFNRMTDELISKNRELERRVGREGEAGPPEEGP